MLVNAVPVRRICPAKLLECIYEYKDRTSCAVMLMVLFTGALVPFSQTCNSSLLAPAFVMLCLFCLGWKSWRAYNGVKQAGEGELTPDGSRLLFTCRKSKKIKACLQTGGQLGHETSSPHRVMLFRTLNSLRA